jgi:hypothetical protein
MQLARKERLGVKLRVIRQPLHPTRFEPVYVQPDYGLFISNPGLPRRCYRCPRNLPCKGVESGCQTRQSATRGKGVRLRRTRSTTASNENNRRCLGQAFFMKN